MSAAMNTSAAALQWEEVEPLPGAHPCPFCGGAPEGGMHQGLFWVSCADCGSKASDCSEATMALELWNRRSSVDLKLSQAELGAAKRLIAAQQVWLAEALSQVALAKTWGRQLTDRLDEEQYRAELAEAMVREQMSEPDAEALREWHRAWDVIENAAVNETDDGETVDRDLADSILAIQDWVAEAESELELAKTWGRDLVDRLDLAAAAIAATRAELDEGTGWEDVDERLVAVLLVAQQIDPEVRSIEQVGFLLGRLDNDLTRWRNRVKLLEERSARATEVLRGTG